ncbi:stage II sporulation protein P [Lentibacillus amyloliquefaciens]|uniref:Stage II sporulation protein P n=1 Tax=Lentibacillus amyloliquefaciens TaxID=1472767 RepID=A0A0U4EXT6_9BACI|nr:stage II sporulation protein P [Lentibacillus amyloliquefaciens]ALX48135.1 stage II sporulation protein P [Lentibacillus amyloliquefaciens]
MYLDTKRRTKNSKLFTHFYKKSSIYIICVAVLFIAVGFLTTVSPAYRVSSNTITDWTGDLDSSLFLYLMGMENKAFRDALPEDEPSPEVSNMLFEMATNIRPSDTRSLLGQELPGFLTFQNEIIVAGEGTDYTNLPVESSPPLEEVLRDRDAVIDENEGEDLEQQEGESQQDTGERDVVFIYNTHNRESFLPHLPDADSPDDAQHGEVNIGKVSQRFADALEANGIGTEVDQTDIMSVLKEQGMAYHESYQASRNVVQEAFTSSEDIQYSFDLHRDAIARDKTTKEINGKNYARVMFVVGAEYADHDKNLELANKLHQMIQEEYPGLSRGVIKKKGSGSNGVYNQDLSPNAMLIEFGGVDNTLEELYRSADAVAEVFSDHYWDAEKVNTN